MFPLHIFFDEYYGGIFSLIIAYFSNDKLSNIFPMNI